ncbi:MAG: response regulator transcription factor [Proteobacteria bacterium]|nr:response regulator transcription factor [Pseudomonadota bacterium]
MRILLVEDDPMLGKAIKYALEIQNNVVDLVSDGESCEAAFKTTNFEIVLLDINLPDKSGLEILKTLRAEKNDIPVLIITARDGAYQKIEGLDLGADDYLSKPFIVEELSARIRSLVRRSKGIATATIVHRELELNPANQTVTKNKTKISIFPKEFNILKILLENRNKIVSKSRLEEALYSWEDGIESNTVEVYIHSLRKKLGQDIIETVRGVGYVVREKK